MCLTTIKPELQINSFKKEIVTRIVCSLLSFFEGEGKLHSYYKPAGRNSLHVYMLSI